MSHRITDPNYRAILNEAEAYCKDLEVFQMFVISRRNGFEYRKQGFISSALIHEQNADNYYNLLNESDKHYAEQVEHFFTEYFLGAGV